MQDPVNLLTPPSELLSITLVILGLIVAVPIYLVVRFLRAHRRRSSSAPIDPSPATTVAVLQDEVDELRAEVAQLTDAQDFTTQLLRERPVHELKSFAKGEAARSTEGPKR